MGWRAKTLAVIVLHAAANDLPSLVPLMASVRAALTQLTPRKLVDIRV